MELNETFGLLLQPKNTVTYIKKKKSINIKSTHFLDSKIKSLIH